MGILDLLRNIFFFGGYLGQEGRSKSFKKPLTPEQEKHYLELMAQGNEEARDTLIEHNLRLVAHIAKKYATQSIGTEDLISIGTIGLIKGVNTFDSAKSSQLAKYIARCIENEILMFMRSDRKTLSEVYLEDSIGVDKEGNNISLLDVLGTEESEVSSQVELRVQTEKLLAAIKKTLQPREQLVVVLRYGLNGSESLPQRRIAEKIGISRSYVSRIEKKALGKLRKELNRK